MSLLRCFHTCPSIPWDGNRCTREGEGGGVLKNKCPYGGMYNFLGEKFSSSLDKHYIIIFGG